ncbi:hypothetical protein GCM10010965_18600 [Caldalkalibacillus thermarum]|uniref:hypothetical protein n=1 Tax=Caldalkalibacillus thermarum TaxID=296745 RepID=UPI00166E083D|nr:hypothetical protein [Caldalkalibacillus thermarum]GGK16929.1 hypothetical protein GCM10010965_07460 [Caldalkalibacillus thermarum]GGK26130.1 hypothetical protein GCM10010965_18600 [Caldalkalibacillus thermarum]
MIKFERYNSAKICPHCHKEFHELYDSYTDTCPECQVEQRGVLVQTEGGWVWQS